MEFNVRNDSENIVTHITGNIKQYSFDAIMRILESMLCNVEDMKKRVRLCSDLRLNVPWNEISDINVKDGNILVHCNRFGIGNLQSSMPNIYIEDFIISRDKATVAFLDVFNNKFLKLSYETSKKYSIPLQNVPSMKSSYAKIITALAGINGEVVNSSDMFTHFPIIKNAILFWKKPCSLSILQYLLTDLLEYPVKVTNFVGGWNKIAEESLTKLGTINHALGLNSVIGDKVWNQSKKFVFFVQNVDYADIKLFQEGTVILKTLDFVFKKYLGFNKNYSIKLHVNQLSIKPSLLNGKQLLGLNIWLNSTKNYDDIISLSSGFFQKHKEQQFVKNRDKAC